jgi:2-iminobutanoate/2-iminopropanoate deaminase
MSHRDPEHGSEAVPTPLFRPVTRHGDLLFLSGQAPVDTTTFGLVAEGFEAQLSHVLKAVQGLLVAAGSSMAAVLRVECMLADATDFPAWNLAFAQAFVEPRPSRTTTVTGFVVPGMLVELQVTAAVLG